MRNLALLGLLTTLVPTGGFAESTAAVPAGGMTQWAPVVAGCANARLPAELLDGAVSSAKSPLRVVEASTPHGKLRLAVADDILTREYGLMCVTRLRAQHGMLFVFPEDGDWEFWMKNTLVPLDMIWMSADGTVTNVAANVPSAARVTNDSAVARRRGRGLFVIELRAGEAAAEEIAVGTHLTLPALHAAQ